MRLRHTTFVAASAAALLLLSSVASPVHAETILQFGGSPAAVTATGNGTTGVTTISVVNGAVSISELGGVTGLNISAVLNLSATNTSVATLNAGDITQHFSGNFSITSGATNYLSGTFGDETFGFNGGTIAFMSASSPPGSIVFTSNYTPAFPLTPPSGVSFTFTNVNPALGIVGSGSTATIASFGGDTSGNFNASPVPEPSTMAIAGLGALGMIGYGLRRRKALGA